MRRKFLIAPIIAGLCFLADQFSKHWARQNLANGIIRPFIPSILQLNFTTNTGGAFSLARGNNEIITVLVLLFTLGITAWIVARERSYTKPSIAELFGMGFLLGGAMSNLCDRIFLGRVTDFLDFSFISFPIFNLADVFIDCGLILIIVTSYLEKPRTKSDERIDSCHHL